MVMCKRKVLVSLRQVRVDKLCNVMAFFGLTYLGYQNPIGDRMILNPREPSNRNDGNSNIKAGMPPSLQEQPRPLRCIEDCQLSDQPLPHSTDIHNGSHERYKAMIKRLQTPRSPNQLYLVPLTESQRYGWMVSKNPEPWTLVRRFPQKNSEMTKFVKEMLKTDPNFSLL
ncbi:testis-expressed protein 49 [Oreochromis aureus]|uniref:testis-expressed protein 49 n=1 Tax=Oreochromis aureus TaxID=47969 RepID=UPI0019549EE4|nr:testis-expressed protein 49 [Oreochromis aureus]